MPKLQQLSITQSKIEDLDWLIKSVENLPKLTKLNLTQNKITKFPSGLDGCIELK